MNNFPFNSPHVWPNQYIDWVPYLRQKINKFEIQTKYFFIIPSKSLPLFFHSENILTITNKFSY